MAHLHPLYDFVADLRRRGIELAADGGNLRVRAPLKALTAAERETLGSQKATILAILVNDPHVATPAGASTPAEPASPGPACQEGRTPSQNSQNSQNVRRRASRAISASNANSATPAEPEPAAPRPALRGSSETLATARAVPASVAPANPTGRRGQSSGVAESPVPPSRSQITDELPAPDTRGSAGTEAGPHPGVRTVVIGERSYPFFNWNGEELAGAELGFDTETALIRGHEVPELALASASSGTEHCLIHPDRLGGFILRHRARHFILHNVAFDFWVVAEHLARHGLAEALEAWVAIVDAGRMHDTMLLDELIRLARTDAYPRPRNLAEVAGEYAGLVISKEDPYRLRYGEIIGADWDGVEEGFFTYAIKDPIATLAAYAAMRPQAIKLMETHGHDPARCR